MKTFDTIILGAGASGVMCALNSYNKNIAIIDKNNKLGKKLAVTGNGRCNLTNLNTSSIYYNANIDKYLKRFDVEATLAFFKSIGLLTYNDNEGRVYPLSNSAKSVIDVIGNAINKKNISIFLEHEIMSITYKDKKFYIETNKENFECEKLVVATGGNSLNEFLNLYKIKHRKTHPSLCALKTTSTRNLENVRISDVEITLENESDKKIERGEILFKDSGISGISIFNLSTLLARKGDYSGKLIIDLLPFLSEKELYDLLVARKNLNVKISNFFDGLFVNQIAYEILNRSKVDENRSSIKLSDKEIQSFVKIIKHLDFAIKGFYNNNQVYSGGVELDALTDDLECKNIENLYFCGEICDVDGECGGFNLQWAWTSGFIVGSKI